MDEEASQEEIELRILLQIFFEKVAEMPMKEQIRMLTDFQDFLVEQREKLHSVST
jgi:hypothetical protein